MKQSAGFEGSVCRLATARIPHVLGRLGLCLAVALAMAASAPCAHAKGNGGNGKSHGPKREARKAGGGNDNDGAKGAHGGKHGKKGKGGRKKGKGGGEAKDPIRPNVMSWLLANNPGLTKNFLTKDPPDREIKIPNGKTVPIFKLKQFLEVNFRLTFFARKQEKGSDVVPVSEEHLRKLLARPEFYDRVLHHRPKYKIAGKGTVSARDAYDYIRHINRRLGVTANKRIKAPVGGGSGINGPSWAVWKAMNLFWHEACHCIGIGHDSGGLSGPIAGSLRDWDRKKKWKYDTIDVNNLGS
jgi:hypothetical protein